MYTCIHYSKCVGTHLYMYPSQQVCGHTCIHVSVTANVWAHMYTCIHYCKGVGTHVYIIHYSKYVGVHVYMCNWESQVDVGNHLGSLFFQSPLMYLVSNQLPLKTPYLHLLRLDLKASHYTHRTFYMTSGSLISGLTFVWQAL